MIGPLLLSPFGWFLLDFEALAPQLADKNEATNRAPANDGLEIIDRMTKQPPFNNYSFS
jgi:hypothetical protein